MNLLHMKYVVEVADIGSVNKAAEKLYVGQSNLSRAIKELESNLGVAIFDRSAKGMALTPEGEIFVRYARDILEQVDKMESLFSKGTAAKRRFSISVPRASYVAEAFVRFSQCLDDKDNFELCYRETNSMRAIDNILHEDYKLGVIRYAENYDEYYKTMLSEKGLAYKKIARFNYVLVMSAESHLASRDQAGFEDLRELTEIAHADPYVPYLPFAQVKKDELPDNVRRRIFVFERGSQFELLSRDPRTYMWVSPIPQPLLQRYGLVQLACPENSRVYMDMFIRRKDYTLSPLDELFVDQLEKTKKEILAQDI